ncbi:MAG: hypothetical protein SVX43_12630 [Cyanobacteriota bacterium]|nr:hypothetical protein [Cyanobacteriota bacterium]
MASGSSLSKWRSRSLFWQVLRGRANDISLGAWVGLTAQSTEDRSIGNENGIFLSHQE